MWNVWFLKKRSMQEYFISQDTPAFASRQQDVILNENGTSMKIQQSIHGIPRMAQEVN